MIGGSRLYPCLKLLLEMAAVYTDLGLAYRGFGDVQLEKATIRTAHGIGYVAHTITKKRRSFFGKGDLELLQ